MVGTGYSLHAAITVCLMSASAPVDSVIRSVDVSSDTTIHIKPCEPVFVNLRVSMDASPDERPIHEAPPELAHRIVINDVEHLYRFNANPLAMFILDRKSVQLVGNSTQVFNVVVMMYWNPEDDDYVFNAPGAYHVELYPGTHLDVIVGEPTREEGMVLAQMQELGLEFAMFVINAEDNRAGKFVPQAEEILQEYPTTAYAKHLSISLGVVKSRALRHEAFAKDHHDSREFATAELALVRKYFEPYCKDDINSPFESIAAFKLAEKLAKQLRYERDAARAVALRRQAIDLFKKVASSPYSLRNRTYAVSRLEKLQAED